MEPTLKQIKEFNSSTIDQELAAEICALVGNDKLWKSQRVKDAGFEITDEFIGKSPDGRGKQFSKQWNDPTYSDAGFVRSPSGCSIKINYSKTDRMFRIFDDGHAMLFSHIKPGDIIGRSLEKGNEYAKELRTYSDTANAIKLVGLYIKHGFYTIENI